MSSNELRYRLISFFLQAAGPVPLSDIEQAVEAEEGDLSRSLEALVGEGLVVEGELLPSEPSPQYCWSAYWAGKTVKQARSARQELQAVIDELPKELGIDSEAVLAFHHFVTEDYSPPRGKRFLVFFQCSVRRPFSKSPSHASMRRAVSAATGFDPAKDFDSCPVHIVVLASNMGPVPYELEDVYPANVRGGGVKHFSGDHYGRVKPILAARMAKYISTHGPAYEAVASFTESRYGEVMTEARDLSCVDFPIFPDESGPRIVRMGESKPRTYWQKHWIQLYLEIERWLDVPSRERARERLDRLDVVTSEGP